MAYKLIIQTRYSHSIARTETVVEVSNQSMQQLRNMIHLEM